MNFSKSQIAMDKSVGTASLKIGMKFIRFSNESMLLNMYDNAPFLLIHNLQFVFCENNSRLINLSKKNSLFEEIECILSFMFALNLFVYEK